MLENNNQCELIIFPNAPHSPSSSTLGDQGSYHHYYPTYCHYYQYIFMIRKTNKNSYRREDKILSYRTQFVIKGLERGDSKSSALHS